MEAYSTFALSFGSKRGVPNPSLAGAALPAPLSAMLMSAWPKATNVELFGRIRNKDDEQQRLSVMDLSYLRAKAQIYRDRSNSAGRYAAESVA
jgi:hypothetical protein